MICLGFDFYFEMQLLLMKLEKPLKDMRRSNKRKERRGRRRNCKALLKLGQVCFFPPPPLFFLIPLFCPHPIFKILLIGDLLLFVRVTELLHGLCSSLETRTPYLAIMASAAKQALMNRYPRSTHAHHLIHSSSVYPNQALCGDLGFDKSTIDTQLNVFFPIDSEENETESKQSKTGLFGTIRRSVSKPRDVGGSSLQKNPESTLFSSTPNSYSSAHSYSPSMHSHLSDSPTQSNLNKSVGKGDSVLQAQIDGERILEEPTTFSERLKRLIRTLNQSGRLLGVQIAATQVY